MDDFPSCSHEPGGECLPVFFEFHGNAFLCSNAINGLSQAESSDIVGKAQNGGKIILFPSQIKEPKTAFYAGHGHDRYSYLDTVNKNCEIRESVTSRRIYMKESFG